MTAPARSVDAIVRSGVVTLSGILTDERRREVLLVAAQNIPGVVKVADDMFWIDPESGMSLGPPAN